MAWWCRWLAALLGWTFGWVAPPAPLPPAMPREAARLVACANDVRRREGVRPLEVDRQLVRRAEGWAATIAFADHLAHGMTRAEFAGTRWNFVGENVGSSDEAGDRVAILCGLFDRSPSHHAAIVNPRYRWAGAAVRRAPDGTTYVVVRFGG